ncbi:hypothetical protein I4U23_027630 [Adineta vaga]|nr:hypothetical protein I4U23_027630 [Adineta vaga]
MCLDLTSDIQENSNEQTKYELSDIKDSFFLKRLGEGTFGFVDLVQIQNNSNIKFACKKITLEYDGYQYFTSQSDLKAMKLVGNDNNSYIVKYYGALIDEGQLIVLMEYLPTSLDLFYKYLHEIYQPKQNQLNQFIKRLTKHILLALNYLKSKNLIHRDIKPQNILISSKSIFKLCDFGICGILKDSISSTHLGSIRYLPPERLGNNCSYGIRSDMWALGMTLLETSQGYLPLSSESYLSYMSIIKNGWQPDIPMILNEQIRELISLLLRHDVNERPRYYEDILSMNLFESYGENPSEDEINLVENIIMKLN